MTVYGYLRVSTDKQDCENQKTGVISLSEKLNHPIEKWIIDDGVSGTKEPEKRQLGKLLKKIKSGDVIICSELSRLGRKLFMVISILEHCMKIGAKVYTVKEGYELGDNVQSKVLAFAFGLVSELEREMISKRTKEALQRLKDNGKSLGRPKGSPNKKCFLKEHFDIKTFEKIYWETKSITLTCKRMKIGVSTFYHRMPEDYKKQIEDIIQAVKKEKNGYDKLFVEKFKRIFQQKQTIIQTLNELGIKRNSFYKDVPIEIREEINDYVELFAKEKQEKKEYEQRQKQLKKEEEKQKKKNFWIDRLKEIDESFFKKIINLSDFKVYDNFYEAYKDVFPKKALCLRSFNRMLFAVKNGESFCDVYFEFEDYFKGQTDQ